MQQRSNTEQPSDAIPDPCIICGTIAAEQLYPSTFSGGPSEAPAYFLAHRTATAHGRIVRCRTCGFVFTSPRFNPDDYDAIYSGIPKPHEGARQYDGAKQARFRRLAAIVRRSLPAGRPFLDFGCGDGAFLREMNDPAGKGFEIGQPGRRQAGPSEIMLGNWASTAGTADLPLNAFTAITAFDVLEHLPRIEEDVTLIRDLLAPAGLLFACVPNIKSVAARAMGRRWNMILLEHLWYFSPDSLDAFLGRFGFQRLGMRALPFDAPLAHVATRLAQTFGMRGLFSPSQITRMVVPVPAGIILVIYRAR